MPMAKRKNPYTSRELNLSCPACSLVTVLSELPSTFKISLEENIYISTLMGTETNSGDYGWQLGTGAFGKLDSLVFGLVTINSNISTS